MCSSIGKEQTILISLHVRLVSKYNVTVEGIAKGETIGWHWVLVGAMFWDFGYISNFKDFLFCGRQKWIVG
eukprot:11263302-Ditylum_brightwellii.AAC.1